MQKGHFLCNLEEHKGQGVLVLLRKFVLHAMDSGAEEEGNQVLVGAFCADLLEDCDVGGAVFKADDEQGMISIGLSSAQRHLGFKGSAIIVLSSSLQMHPNPSL